MGVLVGLVAFVAVCIAAWRVNGRDIGIAEVWIAVCVGIGVSLFARNLLGW